MPEARTFTWLERPARMESFREIEEFVLDAGRAARLPEEKLWKLRLALEELVVNIIQHAYSPAECGSVEIGWGSDRPGEFSVEIRHAGVAFDPLSQEEPDLTLDVEHRVPGGLGIFLARKMVDQITYRYANGINVLSLRLLS